MKYKTAANLSIGAMVFYAVLILFGLGGWIANIVKVVGSDFSTIDGELVVRLVGIFVAPLGAVMGFL